MTPRRKQAWHWWLIALGAALIVLDILFYLAILAPTNRSYASHATEYADMQKTLAAKHADEAKLDSIYLHLQKTSPAEAAQFEKYLWSSEEGFSSLIEFLSESANKHAIVKGRTTFKSARVPDSDLLEVKVELPLEGAYSDLVQFISALEQCNHLLTIDSIALQTAPEAGGLLRLTLSMTTYLKPI